MVIMIVSSVDSLDEILSVRHVDAALIGPNDLSIALGGTLDHQS